MLLLFVCLVLGVLVARFARPPAGIVHGINFWVLNIALSALVLELIPKVRFDSQLWFPIAAMWVTFFGARHRSTPPRCRLKPAAEKIPAGRPPPPA